MFGTRTLLFLGMLAIGAAIDPNNICVLVSDGTKIVDDTSCSSYYTCKGGEATAAECQSGYSFDKDVKGCMPSSQVTCGNVVENPCAGVEDKKFVSNPESCRAYFYCLDGAISFGGSCHEDYYFDEKNQLCDYKSNVACGATGGTESSDNPNFLCAYIPNGMFFGSASDCKAWSKCTDNLIRHGECKDSFVFNVQTGACDYPNNYDCQQLEGDAGETGTNTQCSVPDAIKQNDKSCSSYLKCSNNEWVVVNCPTGLYYEPATDKCKNRNEAVTYVGCNRCEGTTLDFANLVGDGCTGYMRCKNGVQGTDGECGTGYFFNEDFGHCVNENPAFRFCLKECTDCDAATSTTVNSCTADCDAVTCECTCTVCVNPPLPKCSSCLDSDMTQKNKCNTPGCEDDDTCECTCDKCEKELSDCKSCLASDSSQINKCNTPGCETDGTCDCTCDTCGLGDCAAEECTAEETSKINKCNTPGCETDGTCDCTCETCDGDLPVCEICLPSDETKINKCNTPGCETDGTCDCTCETCDGDLPVCEICLPSDETKINKCNTPGCEVDDTCECTCETCDGDLPVCEICLPSDETKINKCNTPGCEVDDTCECTCETCDGDLPVCEICLPSDETKINKCNTPGCETDGTCDCTCETCDGDLPVCEICLSSDSTKINRCNTNGCEDEETCECTCDTCDGLEYCAGEECDADETSKINICNTPDCEDDTSCECFCGACASD